MKVGDLVSFKGKTGVILGVSHYPQGDLRWVNVQWSDGVRGIEWPNYLTILSTIEKSKK